MTFWSRVQVLDQEQCWPWIGAKAKGGYGQAMWEGKLQHAHRVALLLTNGSPPEGKPWALHHCDNRICCNPAHLMWGTPKENTEQMWARGRGCRHGQRGVRNVKAKLTENQVREIRVLYPRWTLARLSHQYGVGISAVQRVVQRVTWKHL